MSRIVIGVPFVSKRKTTFWFKPFEGARTGKVIKCKELSWLTFTTPGISEVCSGNNSRNSVVYSLQRPWPPKTNLVYWSQHFYTLLNTLPDHKFIKETSKDNITPGKRCMFIWKLLFFRHCRFEKIHLSTCYDSLKILLVVLDTWFRLNVTRGFVFGSAEKPRKYLKPTHYFKSESRGSRNGLGTVGAQYKTLYLPFKWRLNFRKSQLLPCIRTPRVQLHAWVGPVSSLS